MYQLLLLSATFTISLVFGLTHKSHSNNNNKNDGECAYFALGVIATPLDSCAVYSLQESQSMTYSYDYSYDGTHLKWNYYSDEQCGALYTSDALTNCGEEYGGSCSDNIEVASGNGCDTVDIKVNGWTPYLEEMNQCEEDTNDYYSMSYVVNECVSFNSLTDGDDSYSAILGCNDDQIYFDYYPDCTDCNCNYAESYIYQYKDDLDGCWDVSCNTKHKRSITADDEDQEYDVSIPDDDKYTQQGQEDDDTASKSTSTTKRRRKSKGKCNKNSDDDARFVKALITEPMKMAKVSLKQSKTAKQFNQQMSYTINSNNMSPSLLNDINGTIMVTALVVVLICGVYGFYRYNKKQIYTEM